MIVDKISRSFHFRWIRSCIVSSGVWSNYAESGVVLMLVVCGMETVIDN